MRATPVPLILALLALHGALPAQEAPRVISLSPAHDDADVDAKAVTELVVVFDRAMSQGGFSFVGGGPAFPKILEGERPRWRDERTCLLPVALEAGHAYSLSLNSDRFQGFKSADGASLAPVPWRFITLPETLPDPRKQKKLNCDALKELKKELPRRYSYYDLKKLDWTKLWAEHEESITGARTTRGWAAAVARALAAAGDLHLYLRADGAVIGTASRSVDALFRRELLPKYVGEPERIGELAAAARTEDGLGYLVVGAWTADLDLDRIDRILGSMRDVEGILLDVRPNAGGDELMAERVAKWFVAGSRVYAKNRYRTGPGRRGFGKVLERRITGNDADRRLDVPVVVLTSPYVMSSCEAFVLMMRQAKDCTVVGGRTYGSSGNPKPYRLVNGVEVVMPSWVAMRPDGTCFEDEGLAPDVPVDVDPAELRTRDPILERALEVLRSKVR